ncbi:ATP-grasp domain-containing protein [Mesorhizobium denitrificans]|uniref:ATP-grasp domain-containing protein n=1 Tax=Mesorhizobium denitrificans TaxID=2294114 RepID=A0A371XC50_9HYPH|nr:ATP-grasp domain-containing protein [Mesorhizobium denitrificans]RFC66802.1 ATP-grasp domain-containing protein [Mesorhizobium denitrificans]
MRSRLLAKSPNKTVLIAAVSSRALAQAARRAGYCVLAADFFEDLDTVAACARTVRLPGALHHGIEPAGLVDTLQQLANGEPLEGLVLGSGFERQPDLVDRLATQFPLAGNGGATIQRIKHPETLAADCAALGIPHPAMRRTTPPDPENWLAKIAGAAGGAHVQSAANFGKRGSYYQQRLIGTPISALFIGDGQRAHVVGFSRQWQSPAPGAPYRYGGAVRLTRFSRRAAALFGKWLDDLTARTGLIGLCSADFIRTRDGYILLEINPRPGATLDIFDDPVAPLFEAHLHACRGQPFALPRQSGSAASMIAYADRELISLPAFEWPVWTADHQTAGSKLAAGDPICSIFGAGETAAAARLNLNRNARTMRERLCR